MKYENFTYIYPPRAENAIPSSLLNSYEKTVKGWIAQVKKNGTNTLIFLSPDKKIFAMGRHKNDHKQWSFTPATEAIFRQRLTGKGWYVINAELLHSKVKGLRDIHYIHDILVEDGQYLIGTTYAQRYARLLMIFLQDSHAQTPSHWVLDDHTWLARNHSTGFLKLFKSLDAPEDEGIVLKKMQGILSARDNSGWTVKCRRPHKNYGF